MAGMRHAISRTTPRIPDDIPYSPALGKAGAILNDTEIKHEKRFGGVGAEESVARTLSENV